MTNSQFAPPRMGACALRIAPVSSGTKATSLTAERASRAAWRMPSPQQRNWKSAI